MKVRALTCFSGLISMYQGEERDVPEGETLEDLLSCGYVEKVQKRGGNESKRNQGG